MNESLQKIVSMPKESWLLHLWGGFYSTRCAHLLGLTPPPVWDEMTSGGFDDDFFMEIMISMKKSSSGDIMEIMEVLTTSSGDI